MFKPKEQAKKDTKAKKLKEAIAKKMRGGLREKRVGNMTYLGK